MDAAHGAFEDVILFFQPREKAGNIPAHIVDGHFAAVVDLLIFHQIPPDLFGGHLAQGRVHGLQQPLHGNAVILDGALRAALDFLGIKEQLQIFLVGNLLFLRFGFGKRLQQNLLQLFHLCNIQVLCHLVDDLHDFVFHIGALLFWCTNILLRQSACCCLLSAKILLHQAVKE